MSDQDELIARFIEVSGSDEDVARFFLSSSNWALEDALSNFWNTQTDERPLGDTDTSNSPLPSSSSGPILQGSDADAQDFKKSATAKPKFATITDMSKRQQDDDDEEEGQAFYAGGSDRSGQQVLGPPKRKNFREQLSDMFRMAQDHSMPDVGPSTSNGASAWGQGVRLGMTENDHTLYNPQNENKNASGGKKPLVVLKLWSQGFSIDDGDLRHYDDPDNKEFLETVLRGEIPQELLAMGRMVNVDVEDHRNEEYKKKTTLKTFKGSGHLLGSPVPGLVTEPESEETNTDAVAKNEAAAREKLKLNSNEPTTTLQIRLADGSRLAAQFNLTHTIADIRQYIQDARPQYSNSNFILVSSFPTRELIDDSSTIETAGLKNAAVMQRLK